MNYINISRKHSFKEDGRKEKEERGDGQGEGIPPHHKVRVSSINNDSQNREQDCEH